MRVHVANLLLHCGFCGSDGARPQDSLGTLWRSLRSTRYPDATTVSRRSNRWQVAPHRERTRRESPARPYLSSNPQRTRTMASATAHPNHQLISSEDVEGTNVYDMKGKNIGEIDHLMIDKVSGRVTYAVMSFGGFLGLGHSNYPIPWGALKYDTKLDGYVTGVSEKQ